MASVTSEIIGEVTANVQSNSLEDAREIRAEGTYFPDNLRILRFVYEVWLYLKAIWNFRPWIHLDTARL